MIEPDSIIKAATKIAPYIITTPLLESDALNKQFGGRLLFKCESLQRTGSFKLRGAVHKLLNLHPDDARAGIIAYSTGNHAQGVALGCRLLQIDAKIIMPDDAPKIKIANTEALGAHIEFYRRNIDDRAVIAEEISRQEGRTLIPPYNDNDIITGQGTVGVEIINDLQKRNIIPDALFCPCGGGGLIAGISTIMHNVYPNLEIYTVEPENFNDTQKSLIAKKRLAISPNFPKTICDALTTETPGEISFAINQKHDCAGLTARDDSVQQAMKLCLEQLKLICEPSGIIGLASLIEGQYQLAGKTAIIVISGGNIDGDEFLQQIKKD